MFDSSRYPGASGHRRREVVKVRPQRMISIDINPPCAPPGCAEVRGRMIIRVIAEEDQARGSGTPQLILLGVLPGSGKTSRGRRVAEEIPAVRLWGDEWMARLGVDWLDEETRDRLEQLFWDLAQDLLRHGQTVILESGFWLRSDRDEKRLGARALGAAVELHYLGVPIAELCRRLAARNAARISGRLPISREQSEHWSTFFEAPDRAGLDLFDGPAPTGPTS